MDYNVENRQNSDPEKSKKRKQFGIAAGTLGAIAAVGVGGFFGAKSISGEREVGPEPSLPTAEAPVTPGVVETPDSEPTQAVEPTNEVTPTDIPTGIEQVPSGNEGESDLTTPITVGPFGNEYAPLHSSEVLVPTVPMEQMREMGFEEFGKLRVEDRLNYLFTTLEQSETHDDLYSLPDDNFVPDFAVYTWSQASMYNFYSTTDPEECSKLAIANILETKDLAGIDLNDNAYAVASEWRSICERKNDMSSFVTSLRLTNETTVREERPLVELGEHEKVSTLEYDVYESAEVVGHRTQECVELTIKLDDGRTVVAYAKGRVLG